LGYVICLLTTPHLKKFQTEVHVCFSIFIDIVFLALSYVFIARARKNNVDHTIESNMKDAANTESNDKKPGNGKDVTSSLLTDKGADTENPN